MKIFITGLYGSLASYFVQYIGQTYPKYKLGGNVRKLRSHFDHHYNSLLETLNVYEADLNHFEDIKKSLEDFEPDVIFNFASHANVRESFDQPVSVLHNNINSTLHLLEAVRSLRINPVVLHCSSSEVYGEASESGISELSPLNPLNPYAVSKTTQDMLSQVYFLSYGLNVIRTRMFSYINPRRLNLFASHFAYQIVQIERGKLDKLRHGNLNSQRTLIDIRDAVKAYWLSFEFGKAGDVYNIGGQHPILVGEVLEILLKKAKVKIQTEQDPKLMRPTDLKYQIPNTDKFSSLTGWSPQYSLDESLDFLLSEMRLRFA